ncbi:MAG TPA: NosD domain-containing protein, partial [Methanothrix sp.]|nr:NosD domain-containing protein [Methanothrix sp.]
MNSGNPEAGIAVLSDNNRISNNTLTNNSGYGLRLSRNSGNTIYGNRIDKNGFDGIYLEGSSSNFIISNSVEDNKINGIYLKDSDKNILKGNLFTNNGKDGILLENSHNNIIIGNSYDSLREVNSQDNIIQENKILTQEDIQIIEPKQEPPSEEILFLQVAPGGSIQQALDSISPGGSIEITGGTYDGTIVIDKANIALLGLG